MHGGLEDATGPVAGALADLAQAEASIARVLSAGFWHLTDPQSVDAVRRTAVLARRVQAAHLTAIADLDDRPGAVAGAPVKHQARALLQAVLHRSKGQAKQDVAAARALRPDTDPGKGGLPRLGAAFAAGEVSREHVDVAVRAVGTLPKELLPALMVDEHGTPILDEHGAAMCAGDVVDERLTGCAREYDSHALAQYGRELKSVLDPDEGFDPDTCLRRNVRVWWDSAGMFCIRGELDPATGALVASLFDHLGSPRRYQGEDEDGQLIDLPDRRSEGQRNADSMGEMAKAAMAWLQSGTRGGEPPRINLTTRPEDLAAARAADATRRQRWSRRAMASGDSGDVRGSAFFPADARHGAGSGGAAGPGCRDRCGCGSGSGDGAHLGTGAHVSPGLLARLACDSVLARALLAPNGAVLDLGRDVRTVTPAQRRALIARDRGCVIPGCTVPGAWAEGHHVQWWSHDGPSDIANLALLCNQHHTEIHTGVWVLEMRDGVPWVIPPGWLDPERRPCRNRFHEQVQDVRDLGTQLHLNLGNGTTSAGERRPDPDEDEPPDAQRRSEDR